MCRARRRAAVTGLFRYGVDTGSFRPSPASSNETEQEHPFHVWPILIHCHILDHEEMGMTTRFEIASATA